MGKRGTLQWRENIRNSKKGKNLGKDNSNYKRYDSNCLECEKKFSTTPKSKKRFCSIVCGITYLHREFPDKWKNQRLIVKEIGLKNKGRKIPFEIRKKMGLKKEKNVNWKGGITSENELLRKCAKYTIWRNACFLRDDFTCQECAEKGCFLHCHHIKPFALFPELRFNLNNGITLCKGCHFERHKLMRMEIANGC